MVNEKKSYLVILLYSTGHTTIGILLVALNILSFSFNSNDAEVGNKPNGTVSPSSTLLINNQTPTVLHTELLGNYKGFSIKPLVVSEQKIASRTPIRPAPSAPTIVAASTDNSIKNERLQISQPVLDATTSSTVRELVSIPLKPAPPIPPVVNPVPMVVIDTKNNNNNINSSSSGGNYPTLRRITSFIKTQKLEEKKTTAPRVNTKFDKEVLKNLEISQPILQNEINVPSEPLPLEADQHKAVVLRAQSLRTTNNTKHRPSVPNFGSLRSKRPTSVVAPVTATATCLRPTSPPPQPPPLPPPSSQPFTSSYQIPSSNQRTNRINSSSFHDNEAHFENIYSVIDESPAVEIDDNSLYKVPKSLGGSLLGEIVSAIQERNHESIYTSKPTSVQPNESQQQQQTYENFSPSPSGSTTSSGYMCPVDLKSSQTTTYDRPDLVKNCDEKRLFNRSPDVLEAKKHHPLSTASKPAVLFPKPIVGIAASKSSATATVGLKKKLSNNRQPSKVVSDIQKRFENSNNPKTPPLAAKPTLTSNR